MSSLKNEAANYHHIVCSSQLLLRYQQYQDATAEEEGEFDEEEGEYDG